MRFRSLHQDKGGRTVARLLIRALRWFAPSGVSVM
jgi:hypothetical protein